MLGELAVLALAATLVRRGWWRKFGEMELRAPWLFVAALALQVTVAFAGGRPWFPFQLEDRGQNLLITISYFGLIIALLLNLKTPGFGLIALGVLLNLIVTAANGGRMPVSPDALNQAGLQEFLPILEGGSYGKHSMAGAGSRFWILADVIPLRPPYYPLRRVISLGDIVITLGSLQLLLTLIMSNRKQDIGVGGRPKVQRIQ